MSITEKFITTFTAKKAEAIITAGTKMDRRYSAMLDKRLDYSDKAVALKAKIAAHNDKWEEIENLIDEDHSQYSEICMTGFLDG